MSEFSVGVYSNRASRWRWFCGIEGGHGLFVRVYEGVDSGSKTSTIVTHDSSNLISHYAIPEASVKLSCASALPVQHAYLNTKSQDITLTVKYRTYEPTHGYQTLSYYRTESSSRSLQAASREPRADSPYGLCQYPRPLSQASIMFLLRMYQIDDEQDDEAFRKLAHIFPLNIANPTKISPTHFLEGKLAKISLGSWI
jgi:hypothetical protein